jgi:hypothetical protein
MPYTPFWVLHLENFGTVISEYLCAKWTLAYVSFAFFGLNCALFTARTRVRSKTLTPDKGPLEWAAVWLQRKWLWHIARDWPTWCLITCIGAIDGRLFGMLIKNVAQYKVSAYSKLQTAYLFSSDFKMTRTPHRGRSTVPRQWTMICRAWRAEFHRMESSREISQGLGLEIHGHFLKYVDL